MFHFMLRMPLNIARNALNVVSLILRCLEAIILRKFKTTELEYNPLFSESIRLIEICPLRLMRFVFQNNALNCLEFN